ncbi:hypothetical protein QVD17_27260 [Tagetes erecta]|uniref:Uncharacterized protein n=1 Tax=Tagetes erecta TaxID=13708 RepID=A0AAD8KBJ7_TARER|nr:hypothetical protein QVD17_27260 [Tagetes erecta]
MLHSTHIGLVPSSDTSFFIFNQNSSSQFIFLFLQRQPPPTHPPPDLQIQHPHLISSHLPFLIISTTQSFNLHPPILGFP